ncbi:DUF4123 domain-containing protein [Burkholderia ubonensis]|uniref:DUF4123 domain-containing protein n=1 Tax=Burkholderia ubonensis TaxID=101571 RepID=UPI002AB062F8|nr:DUF4123 domain-containing protein [Burkholderia ubonensis]
MMNSPNTSGAGRPESVDALSEAGAIDTIASVLRTYFGKHPEMHCYLAVDPSQRDLPIDGALSTLPRAIVAIEHEAYPDARRPYLVELDLSSPEGAALLLESTRLALEDRRPTSMSGGLGQRIGGWLASTASLDAVAARWSRQTLQYDEKGRVCALRFYDARALSLIWPLLTEQQRQALLGPVKTWHALDACAKLFAYGSGTESSQTFSLTRAQWPEVHRHGLINRALALHALAAGRQPMPAEVSAAVAAAARAEQYGLHDYDDLVAFIGHALEWHPQFDRHPKLVKALQQFSSDDFYTAVIGDLQPDEIEEIRRGGWDDEARASSSIAGTRPMTDTRYEE